MNRVVVTGVGVICAIGNTREEFWRSLKNGHCGIGPIQSANCSNLRFQNGAEVKNYDASKFLSEKQAESMDRFAQFAVIAAREAVNDARIVWDDALQADSAVITGACVGGQSTEDKGFVDVYKLGHNRIHPMSIPKIMANAGACQIAMEFGLTGPTFTLSTACSSAAHAFGLGFWLVRSGAVPLALVGGSEAPFSFGILKAWEAMRVVSGTTCRPFSKDRSGMILGEGSAILILETLHSAQKRAARIYAEVVGCGMSADAGHLTQPYPQGASLAIRRALDDACLTPDRISYINAHGTGTEINDAIETRAIRDVFGLHADRLAVSSTKSMHGHALGAAAALEAAASVLALYHGVIPPTINFREHDPACDLDYVPNESRVSAVEYCLSTSLAFGGLNVALAFHRY